MFTGAEAAEIVVNQAEQSRKITGTQPAREDSPEDSDGEVIVPVTPPRPAGERRVAGESQGGTIITLALRTPERLRLGPELAPKVSSS